MKRSKSRPSGAVRHEVQVGHVPVRPEGSVRRFDLPIWASAPTALPTISACMIVRNEEPNLRPCLESLGDLASEIIVVDTGSMDNTVQIAREMGAKVFHFTWIDDFAAARNESLRHATKEWIFWLDADDRLDAKAVAQLKNAVASGRADAYMCLVSSKKPHGSEDVVEHIRLFRNHLGVRFTGAIHEVVFPDLVRLGLKIARAGATVEHTGYESPELSRKKMARNLEIIERELTASPGRLDLLFYRGQARRAVEQHEGAEADLRAYLSRTKPAAEFDWTRFWAYNALAYTLEDLRREEEAERLLGAALREFPGHPGYLFHMGRLHLTLGRAKEAVTDFHAALARLSNAAQGLRPSELWIEMGLAQAYSDMGSSQEAATWAEKARAHAPSSYEVAEMAARMHIEAGNFVMAEAVLTSMLATVDLPAPWRLLARLRQKQGKWDAATGAVEQARERGMEGHEVEAMLADVKAARLLAETRTQGPSKDHQSPGQLQGLALLARGDHLQAAECFADAINGAPTDPDNYRYLAVTLKALGQESQALEAWKLAEHYRAMA